jgi:outer membrane protein OmpA-like peptidoglycan-associated protein
MQPRFAALLFVLGLVDLAYVNLGPGHQVFANAAAPLALEAPPPPRPAPTPPTSADVPPALVPLRSGEAPEPGVTAPAPHTGAAAERTASERLTPEPATQAATPAATERDPSLPATDVTVGFPDTASSILTGRARDELLALAARLRAHPNYYIHIVGYADSRGTREFNRDLGGRRARTVSELLTMAGVSREQLGTESRGEDEPRAVGTSERVWAANRRVEITIISEKGE